MAVRLRCRKAGHAARQVFEGRQWIR